MNNLTKELSSKIEQQIEKILDEENDDLFDIYLKQVKTLWPLSLNNRILAMLHYGIGTYHVVASKTRWNNLAKEQEISPLVIDGKEIYAYPQKGSHGAKLFRPNPIFAEKEDENGEIKKVVVAMRFAVYTAFAEKDIIYASTKEPIKLPDFVADYNVSPFIFSSLISFCEEKEIEVKEEKIADFAKGYSYGGKIVLEEEDEIGKKTATLIHEIAHEILHQKNHNDELPKFIVEGEAEITSAIVMQYFGYQTERNSAAYVRQHIKHSQIEKKEAVNLLKKSMERILYTSQEIIDGIEKHLSNGEKECEA